MLAYGTEWVRGSNSKTTGTVCFPEAQLQRGKTKELMTTPYALGCIRRRQSLKTQISQPGLQSTEELPGSGWPVEITVRGCLDY